ncbi:hypothetical protein BU16DRAFT_522613 [Lophium mytilinum]|uniref:Uncharacterized protein n=1 Tax=Lophium mytilinum TaxID=390894 RepID=A0A6A6RD90_9PEZI|nr:hypothetical protein BU16DRAFT_522613 [Lophium mytilinum]
MADYLLRFPRALSLAVWGFVLRWCMCVRLVLAGLPIGHRLPASLSFCVGHMAAHIVVGGFLAHGDGSWDFVEGVCGGKASEGGSGAENVEEGADFMLESAGFCVVNGSAADGSNVRFLG